MFSILKRLLKSEAGWISAAMMIGSMVGNGIMNSKKGKGLGASGLEMSYRDTNKRFEDQRMNELNNFITPVRDATQPGLMGAAPEIFSQRPNSGEYDAIANQEKNLKNQALNTGARGGLLKNQMFEAAKNAASNKLGVMENARQNALQRATSLITNMMPNNSTNLTQENLVDKGSQFMVDTELKRKIPAQAQGAAGAAADQSGLGGGLGSILGGMDLSSIMSLFGGGGGAVSGAVGGSPSFSMAGAGQGFSNIMAM